MKAIQINIIDCCINCELNMEASDEILMQQVWM
jgi:hypothetical protein